MSGGPPPGGAARSAGDFRGHSCGCREVGPVGTCRQGWAGFAVEGPLSGTTGGSSSAQRARAAGGGGGGAHVLTNALGRQRLADRLTPAFPPAQRLSPSCAPRLAGPSDRGGRRPGTSTPPAAPTQASPRGPSSHPVPHHLAEHAPPVCPATLCHCAPSHCHFSGAGPGRDLGPVLSTSPATAVTSHGLAAHTADQQEPCAWARARGEGPRLAEPCREGGLVVAGVSSSSGR